MSCLASIKCAPIVEFTYSTFNKQIKKVTYDEHCPRRILFEFDTQNSIKKDAVPKFVVRPTKSSDIEAIGSLSKTKSLTYEEAQPQFWHYTGEEGDNSQRQWFKELLEDTNYLMFTTESDTQEILKFITGNLIPAAEVYNQGGLTLMVDGCYVKSENLWQSIEARLIEAAKTTAKAKGATKILVVCCAHDHPKRKFLSAQNLSAASE